MDEKFAPCDMDDHDLMFRAYLELGKVCGAYAIEMESDSSWSGARVTGDLPMWAYKSQHKNSRIFMIDIVVCLLNVVLLKTESYHMRIEVERWCKVQTEEFSHHQDLRLEAYITATKMIAKYFEFDYETDFKDKIIVEVGAGAPRGSILNTKGNFKRGIVVEPLIDRWYSKYTERL